MANIMINEVCNLNCPYCFANQFVNKDCAEHNKNITIENFKKAVDFTLSCGSERIGIIGGEPTIHPNFIELMELLFEDSKVNDICLFTNGMNLDKVGKVLMNPKVHCLVNLNSPKDIGQKNFDRILKNLDYLINECYLGSKIGLGINMYKEDFDYDYMIDSLRRFKLKKVRTAIAVPNSDEKRNFEALDYFNRMKPRVIEFFLKCKSIGVIPSFDCNYMPNCCLNQEERDLLYTISNNDINNSINKNPYCTPVIDIRSDLSCARCFGCSDYLVNIKDFKNISDLRRHFIKYIDNPSKSIGTDSVCENCYEHKTDNCMGSCIAFKREKIKSLIDLTKLRGDK